MEINWIAVGERLKDLRGDQTQEEFGKAFDSTKNVVSQYEAGYPIPIEKLNKISLEYNVPIDWLIHGDKEVMKGLTQKEGYDYAVMFLEILKANKPIVSNKILPLIDDCHKELHPEKKRKS